jgi:hypothetical protein
MKSTTVFLLICTSVFGQTKNAPAETKGACSPANTGNNNTFNITCQGIPEKLGAQLIDLLNRIAKNQADAETVLSKLDGCIQGVKEVREQQARWRMTAEQTVRLRELLSGHHASVEIHVLPSDSNSSVFGTDLLTALKPYTTVPDASVFTSDFNINPQLEGLALLVSHSDFPEAVYLQQSLRAAINLNVQGLVDPKTVTGDKDRIVLFVGAKPSKPLP